MRNRISDTQNQNGKGRVKLLAGLAVAGVGVGAFVFLTTITEGAASPKEVWDRAGVAEKAGDGKTLLACFDPASR